MEDDEADLAVLGRDVLRLMLVTYVPAISLWLPHLSKL
jgi:TRAP-type C4-dicarboxylate transport system permease large subunit